MPSPFAATTFLSTGCMGERRPRAETPDITQERLKSTQQKESFIRFLVILLPPAKAGETSGRNSSPRAAVTSLQEGILAVVIVEEEAEGSKADSLPNGTRTLQGEEANRCATPLKPRRAP